MKNAYHTEIYLDLGMFTTKTTIKYLNIKRLKIHKIPLYKITKN